MRLCGGCVLVLLCRDRVEWGEEQKRAARGKVEENASQHLPDHVRGEGCVCSCVVIVTFECVLEDYERKASQHWNGFYQQHQNRFISNFHCVICEDFGIIIGFLRTGTGCSQNFLN